MPNSYFPLCWESSGDQWWYASPIDLAAANGHCDLVNQLLHIDPNHLIKLTSLRRIRRLESVWDDNGDNGVAQCRAHVARTLLLGCEPNKGGQTQTQNPLIRAGYGGWLLYTAASAGDMGFVKDILERDPLLVFGEGEYGITDIFYAAARSKNSKVFRLLLEFAMDVMSKENGEVGEGFVREMMNRAVHAAARGGNLEVLKELLLDCYDLLGYRDGQGSTVLHSASCRGQVEVVEHLVATYGDVINSTDIQGNTALHVAAYRGYSSVVEALALASPSLVTSRNNDGDTFLHMAVAGFRSPGFHRIDQQMDLVKRLISGKIISLNDTINIRNNQGKTALHLAVAANIQCNVVELLMTVPSIDLNIQNIEGFTPLDLLKQCPKAATSGRIQGIGTSPGSSFRVPDSELFTYSANDSDSDISCEPPSSRFSPTSSEVTSHFDSESNNKYGSANSTSRRLKFLLKWPMRGEKNPSTKMNVDDTLTPLRQKFTKFPSPSAREKFAASLMHGVIHATQPRSGFSSAHYSPSSPFESLASSLASIDKLKDERVEGKSVVRSSFYGGPSSVERSQVNDQHRRVSSFSRSLMNEYFCFGAQGLAVEEPVTYRRANRSCRRLVF